MTDELLSERRTKQVVELSGKVDRDWSTWVAIDTYTGLKRAEIRDYTSMGDGYRIRLFNVKGRKTLDFWTTDEEPLQWAQEFALGKFREKGILWDGAWEPRCPKDPWMHEDTGTTRRGSRGQYNVTECKTLCGKHWYSLAKEEQHHWRWGNEADKPDCPECLAIIAKDEREQ